MYRNLLTALLFAVALVVPRSFAQPAYPSPTLALPKLDLDGSVRSITGWLNTARPPDKAVFLGGTSVDFCVQAANATIMAPLIAMGSIGLYEHANGIAPCSPAQRTAIWNLWAPTGESGGGGQAVGETGGSFDAQYLSYFGGILPVQINMNLITGAGVGSGTYTAVAPDLRPGTVYTGYFTSGDKTSMIASCTAAATAGAKNAAPFMAPNGGGEDLDDPFATGAFWANARATALSCGGIALDTPSNYALIRGAPYTGMIAQMILWCEANGLRVSQTISPYADVADAAGNTGGAGYEPLFREHTIALVNILRQAGAVPTQYVVESYDGGVGTVNGLYTSGGAPGGVMPFSESLTSVALYLATAETTAATGTTTPTVVGMAAERGLQSLLTPVPIATTSASTTRIGPLRRSDVPWLHEMALQDPWAVAITGGTISGASIAMGAGSIGSLMTFPSIPITTQGPALFGGSFVLQGAAAFAFDDTTVPGTLRIVQPGGNPAGFSVTGPMQAASFSGPTSSSAVVPNGLLFPAGSNSVSIASPGGVGGTTGLVNVYGTGGPVTIAVTGALNATSFSGAGLTVTGVAALPGGLSTGLIQQDSSVGAKLNMYAASYGIGVSPNEFALYSAGTWAFRSGGISGPIAASLTAAGALTTTQGITAGGNVAVTGTASVQGTANAIVIAGSGTGVATTITATGSDANIGISYIVKGSATHTFTGLGSFSGGLNNTIIGQYIPLSGAFTTLSATGTLTAAGAFTAPSARTTPGLFSALGTCTTALEGTRKAVTDATASTPGATLAGGGSIHMPAYCNGSAWVGL